MERQNTGGTGRNDDSAQLILIAGLLVAIAVVGIAVVVGGGFFSQSTTDGGGISSLSSQVSNQLGTAEEVSQEDLSFVNQDSARYEGRDPIQVCDEMVNSTKLQQRIASQLAEDEVILGVELLGECDDGFVGNRSWLAGQTEIANLPSVNVTERQTVDVNEICGDATSGLHSMTGYPDHTNQFIEELKDVYAPSNVPENPDLDKMVDALENADDIDLTALPSAIDPVDYVDKCIKIEIEEGRNPADVVFAIDTTGSMGDLSVYSGDFVRGSWQTSPHSEFPRESLTDTHRPETGVMIPDEWVDVRCATTEPCTWSGGSSGEIVYDNDAGRFAEITSDSPSGQVCTNYHWYYGYCTNYEDTWEVEYRDGSTEDVVVTDLYNADYRLRAPERMWYTQQGMKAAVDDLDRNEPDRAGLIGYDTGHDEKAGVEGVDDAGHRQTLKVETDRLDPDGGTDIAGGLDEAKEILERDYGSGPDSSPDATRNIVLMTDGRDNEGEDPVDYIQDNREDFEDTFIHVIILGETAADSEEAIEDMGALADDPNPDLSSSDVDTDDLPDWEAVNDPNRVNGTLIASDDPEDAENIFNNITDSIEDETEFEEPNSSITDPGNDVSGTTVANSGVVEEIYDFRMNVSDFTSNGTYRINIVDTNATTGNEELIWRMDVDNKMADNDAGTTGYEVKFSSETDNSLNATLQRTFEGNLSDDVSPDEYVWFDLTGKDSDRPRLKMGPSGPDEDDYDMEAAWQEISEQMDDGGVAIQTTEINPFGQVNGTFSLDFRPLNGNFSRVNNIAGGGFSGDCDPSASDDDIITCGWEDTGNTRNAVSTAQIRDARVLVTVEGPGGISKREIRIDDFVDIYEEQI